MEQQGQEIILARIEDLIREVAKKQKTAMTPFLDPATQKKVERYLKGFPSINYMKSGGYPSSERNVFLLCPNWQEPSLAMFPLTVLSIGWDSRYYEITHRDILGAVLGLGIKREKIGDIIINGNRAQVITLEDIRAYIQSNLYKVGNAPVSIEQIDWSQLDVPKPVSKVIKATVASMRLDCVASSGFGISRNKIIPLIREGRMSVNWELVLKPDFQTKEGDLISLRGSGRIKISEQTGMTRKNRIALIIEKYI